MGAGLSTGCALTVYEEGLVKSNEKSKPLFVDLLYFEKSTWSLLRDRARMRKHLRSLWSN